MRTHKQNHVTGKPKPGFAGAAGHPSLPGHEHALDDLRAQIRRIEKQQKPFPEDGISCVPPACTSPEPNPEPAPTRQESGGKTPWAFAIDEIDRNLPGCELSRDAIHEIKPESHRDTHAALSFAIALAGRCAASEETASAPPGLSAQLWCLPPSFTAEFGQPYAPGMGRLITQPENCLISEPGTAGHLLWALEEGLNLGALTLVLGAVRTLKPTPARRLSLRAGKSRTPCLLLTHHDSPGINMARTRWRIGRAQSTCSQNAAQAPGPDKWRVSLERAPGGIEGLQWILEWRHETLSFALATPLADRAPETVYAGQRTRQRAGLKARLKAAI